MSGQPVAARLAAIAGRRTLGDAAVEDEVLTALIRTTDASGGRIYGLDLSLDTS